MALAANCMQSSHKHRGRAGYIAKSRGIFEEVRIFWLAAPSIQDAIDTRNTKAGAQ
jgi:hypothetical protein